MELYGIYVADLHGLMWLIYMVLFFWYEPLIWTLRNQAVIEHVMKH